MFHLNHLLISKHNAALVLQHVLDVLPLDAAFVDLLCDLLKTFVQVRNTVRIAAVRCLLLDVPAALVDERHRHHVHALLCASALAVHEDPVIPAQMLLAHAYTSSEICPSSLQASISS